MANELSEVLLTKISEQISGLKIEFFEKLYDLKSGLDNRLSEMKEEYDKKFESSDNQLKGLSFKLKNYNEQVELLNSKLDRGAGGLNFVKPTYAGVSINGPELRTSPKELFNENI